jgi:phosphohistidine phosphatase
LKTLFLVRHAKSSWSDATLADRERPLAKRGRRAARRMGRRLAERKARPDLMISSPALRALKTARLMARKLQHPRRRIQVDDTLYAATLAAVLRRVRDLDERYARVMLFGHNPQIAQLVRHFSRRITPMPTCAVACFTFAADAWSDVGPQTLRHVEFDYPKKDPK